MNATSNFILNDITIGNNKCTASCSHCCSEGFKAGVGWDPLTGFGSVDFNRFLYFFSSYTTKSSTATFTTDLTDGSSQLMLPLYAIIVIPICGSIFLAVSLISLFFYFKYRTPEIHDNVIEIVGEVHYNE
jgi:hypothetical protein